METTIKKIRYHFLCNVLPTSLGVLLLCLAMIFVDRQLR